MKVGIAKEVFPGECRVAATPETARRLIEKLGFEVLIQSGAGEAASFSDDAYRDAGCEVASDAAAIWGQADIVLKVRPPEEDEVQQLRDGQTLIGFLAPAQNGELLQRIADRQATALSIDAVPRISRAQKLDALSSMANIAGYRAVVEAAGLFGTVFHRANHRRRQSSSGQSLGDRRRRRGTGRDRNRAWIGCDRPRL